MIQYVTKGFQVSIKRDKFVELAEKRVVKAIKDIRLIGNLANTKNYEYTDEDARHIIKVLDSELKVLKSKFEQSVYESSVTFTLKKEESE